MKNSRKYVAEFIGTMVLVILGCGSAINGSSDLAVAFTFGLAVTTMAYIIGGISGCHINPAVSLGLCLSDKMKPSECIKYIISQFLGGIVGAAILVIIFNSNSNLGANGFAEASAMGIVWYRALTVEIIMTAIFVLTILVVTSKKEYASISGLIIGLTLTIVHIFAIPITGTSVNPARSLGPALFTGGLALEQVWLFIVGPLFGAVIAAAIYKLLIEEKN